MSTVSSFPVPPLLHRRAWGDSCRSHLCSTPHRGPIAEHLREGVLRLPIDALQLCQAKHWYLVVITIHHVFATPTCADSLFPRFSSLSCAPLSQGPLPTWRTPAMSDSAPGTSACVAGRSSTHKRTRGTSSPPSAPSPPSTPTSSSPSSTALDSVSWFHYATPLRLVQRGNALVCSKCNVYF